MNWKTWPSFETRSSNLQVVSVILIWIHCQIYRPIHRQSAMIRLIIRISQVLKFNFSLPFSIAIAMAFQLMKQKKISIKKTSIINQAIRSDWVSDESQLQTFSCRIKVDRLARAVRLKDEQIRRAPSDTQTVHQKHHKRSWASR